MVVMKRRVHPPVVRQARMREHGINYRGLRRRPPVARRAPVDSWAVSPDTGRCMALTLRNARRRLAQCWGSPDQRPRVRALRSWRPVRHLPGAEPCRFHGSMLPGVKGTPCTAAHARSEVPGCMGEKGRLQCLSLVTRGGPMWSAAAIWRGCSTRPGWRGAPERSLVRSVIDAGIAVKGFIPAAMSLTRISSL
jgi:hypothetical protein